MKDSEKLLELNDVIKGVIKELKQPLEYITLEEVLKVTGLSEKTIREHLRGAVTCIGRNAWDRKEFFDYWKKNFYAKQKERQLETVKIKEILQKVL